MNQVEQSVAEYVDEVWEDVVADIEQLVSYPSVAVSADAEPGAPFGRPVRDALDCALGIAQKLGYQTSDDEGYVGIADIPGRGDKQLATICHVDVVPAGPGWNTYRRQGSGGAVTLRRRLSAQARHYPALYFPRAAGLR